MAAAAVTPLSVPCPYHNFKIVDTNKFLTASRKTLLKRVHAFAPWYKKELHPYVTVLTDGCSNGFIHLLLVPWSGSILLKKVFHIYRSNIALYTSVIIWRTTSYIHKWSVCHFPQGGITISEIIIHIPEHSILHCFDIFKVLYCTDVPYHGTKIKMICYKCLKYIPSTSILRSLDKRARAFICLPCYKWWLRGSWTSVVRQPEYQEVYTNLMGSTLYY